MTPAEFHQCAKCNRLGADFPATLIGPSGRVERHRVCRECFHRIGPWLKGWVRTIVFEDTAP